MSGVIEIPKANEEHELKDLEKDKKLTDALKQIDDLKNKIQQGSQQTQGESLELKIEARLKSEFPMDVISEVKKGYTAWSYSNVRGRTLFPRYSTGLAGQTAIPTNPRTVG